MLTIRNDQSGKTVSGNSYLEFLSALLGTFCAEMVFLTGSD